MALLEFTQVFLHHLFSRTKLLDSVWGYNNGTSSNVVDVAIAKLRKKINFEGCVQLISSIRGNGYMFAEDSSS